MTFMKTIFIIQRGNVIFYWITILILNFIIKILFFHFFFNELKKETSKGCIVWVVFGGSYSKIILLNWQNSLRYRLRGLLCLSKIIIIGNSIFSFRRYGWKTFVTYSYYPINGWFSYSPVFKRHRRNYNEYSFKWKWYHWRSYLSFRINHYKDSYIFFLLLYCSIHTNCLDFFDLHHNRFRM